MHRKMTSLHASRLLKILPEVSKAVANKKPVVALESTILAHGLPYPENRNLASDLSAIFRSVANGNGDEGVTAATIAMKDGFCHVGLSSEDVDDLCRNGATSAIKCSTRDIPFFLAKHQQARENLMHNDSVHRWGATTVASTMRLAHLAGITTFVTGGTGGVHRGAEVDMDISADLIELSRTPVVVVSAGVKSILDIGLTLEQLETLGVPVAVFGSDSFPAFFSPVSGYDSPNRVDSAEEVAKAYWASRDLGLPNGMLICCPNPDPAGQEIEYAIQESLTLARKMGLTGKAITPFLLKNVSERTGGASLRSNLALVKRNAQVGAEISSAIAKEGARRENSKDRLYPSTNINKQNLSHQSNNAALDSKRIVVMGGSVIDIIAKSSGNLISGTSNPGVCKKSHGGVARNIAEALGRLGAKPIFYTALGDDTAGKEILLDMESVYGVDLRTTVAITKSQTPTYTAILDDTGEMVAAIADMESNRSIPFPHRVDLNSAGILVADANAPIDTLTAAAKEAKMANIPIFFETTSVPKCTSVARSGNFLKYVTYMSPNYDELLAMTSSNCLLDDTDIKDQLLYFDDENITIKIAAVDVLGQMNPSEAHILITLGKYGLVLASKDGSGVINFSLHEALCLPENASKTNVTGAGDTLCAAFIFSLMKGEGLTKSIEFSMNAAAMSVQWNDGAIPPHISDLLRDSK